MEMSAERDSLFGAVGCGPADATAKCDLSTTLALVALQRGEPGPTVGTRDGAPAECDEFGRGLVSTSQVVPDAAGSEFHVSNHRKSLTSDRRIRRRLYPVDL